MVTIQYWRFIEREKADAPGRKYTYKLCCVFSESDQVGGTHVRYNFYAVISSLLKYCSEFPTAACEIPHVVTLHDCYIH